MIYEGGLSPVEMACALGMGRPQLEARLLMMEQLGFLAIMDSCECSDQDAQCRCCGFPCTGTRIRGYRLTGKGLLLVKGLIPATTLRHPRR